jgi:hypothetical protein
MRRKTMYIKERQGWKPIDKKYKANENKRTHVMKEHNNQDITNTLIKYKIIN